MDRLQAWFERIAGVTQEERARRHFAHELFGRPSFDSTAFQMPACWRRRDSLCRVGRR